MHRLGRAVLAVAILAVPASAAVVEEVPATPLRRSLGPHLYIPRDGVTDPFTASSVSSSSGFATGSAKGPTFDLDGQPVNIEDYKYPLLHPGVHRTVGHRRLLGGPAEPGGEHLQRHQHSGRGWRRGERAGSRQRRNHLLLSDRLRLRLGVLVDVVWGPSVAISILDTIGQSVSSGSVQALVDDSYATTVTPALSLALHLRPRLGRAVQRQLRERSARGEPGHQ